MRQKEEPREKQVTEEWMRERNYNGKVCFLHLIITQKKKTFNFVNKGEFWTRKRRNAYSTQRAVSL